MHVLHVTAHLGGGVGKAHAALRAVMPDDVSQTYLLLEEPRDRRYADEIVALGGTVIVAADLADGAARCAAADIVQFEFWNHPKLFECLARTDFPPVRSVFWAHVSGLFTPVIAEGLFAAADRFVFTTPASMVLGEALPAAERWRLSAIGSGFGFPAASPPPSVAARHLPLKGGEQRRVETSPHLSGLSTLDSSNVVEDVSASLQSPPLRGRCRGATEGGSDVSTCAITYLGTVDFIKMHPGFFDAIDGLSHDVNTAIWGTCDLTGEVAAKAAAMRHPHRIRFRDQTNDPEAALAASRIFFYPLQPDHYGTAENALIEAMSLGLVPVVLANPAECAIVTNGVTGYVARSIGECTEILGRLLAHPDEVRAIGENAARHAAEHYQAKHSAAAFMTLWTDLMTGAKHQHDFASVTGPTPLDWYRATQSPAIRQTTESLKHAKGTLSHFRSAFPDDPCWEKL
jgi:hypothetical protein